MKGNTVPNQTETADTCGNCQNWKETRGQCPGMGFCQHPKASSTRAGDVNVSCRYLPSKTKCLIVIR